MKPRDYQDLIGGILLLFLGLFAAVYAQRYDFGTLARIGPGFFPSILGALLAVLGLLIAWPAWRRVGKPVSIHWQAAVLVLISIAAFALLLRTAGLIAAAFISVVIASLADHQTTWRFRLLLATGVTLVTVLIFKVGLGMLIPLW